MKTVAIASALSLAIFALLSWIFIRDLYQSSRGNDFLDSESGMGVFLCLIVSGVITAICSFPMLVFILKRFSKKRYTLTAD